MASLRDLADRALQRSRQDGTAVGTSLKLTEQDKSLFQTLRLVPRGVEQVLQQKIAKSGPCSTVPFPKGGTNGTSALPAFVAAGLYALQRMACPMGVNPKAWRSAVVDAIGIADAHWAQQALALGWSALDLFGAGTDKEGDPYADGLAVWLARRRLLAVTAEFAVADDGRHGRVYFNRRKGEGAILLWEFR